MADFGISESRLELVWFAVLKRPEQTTASPRVRAFRRRGQRRVAPRPSHFQQFAGFALGPQPDLAGAALGINVLCLPARNLGRRPGKAKPPGGDHQRWVPSADGGAWAPHAAAHATSGDIFLKIPHDTRPDIFFGKFRGIRVSAQAQFENKAKVVQA
jgi:hypothetical protein